MQDIPVTVIGLGAMGGGMANRLLDLGCPLTVYNRTAAATAGFVARGAKAAANPAAAVRKGGIVITMVANDAAMDEVALGRDGFVAALGDGVHLSMSTLSAACVQRIAAAQAREGSACVAAPVFGRGEAAASGKLWIALSGPAAAKARAMPVLEALSQGRFDFGETPEAAALAKLAGNFMIFAATEAMGEAFALLQKNGVDARQFFEMITQSIFAAPIYKNYGPLILDRRFAPPGFRLALGAKDCGLVIDAATASQAPMPLASLVRDRLLAAMANGRSDLDLTALALGAAEDAGLPV